MTEFALISTLKPEGLVPISTFVKFVLTLSVACLFLPQANAGNIEGTVVISRKLTKRNVTVAASVYQRGVAVNLAVDPAGDPLAYERMHTVIYLEGTSGSLAPSPAQIVLEQKDRRFVPDLLVVPAGSSVTFPNRDLILHNVFSLSKPKTFDLGTYPKDQTRTTVLNRPGVVYVNCHLHPNMSAAIVVTPNQWSARPDASGNFVIPNVPAGMYTAVAWHKTAGFFRRQLRVQDNGTATVEFVLPYAAVTQ